MKQEEKKRMTCKSCKKLLFKTREYGKIKGVEIEIMCRNRECKKINKFVL